MLCRRGLENTGHLCSEEGTELRTWRLLVWGSRVPSPSGRHSLGPGPTGVTGTTLSQGNPAGPLWLLWCSHCCHMGYAQLSPPGGHMFLPLPTGLCTHTGLHVPQWVVCVCVHLSWCSVLERAIPPLSGYTEMGSPRMPGCLQRCVRETGNTDTACVRETGNTDTRSYNPCQPCQAAPRGRRSCVRQASGKRYGANCFVTCFYDIIILI